MPNPKTILPLLLLLVVGVYLLLLQQLKQHPQIGPLPYKAPSVAPARFGLQQLLPAPKAKTPAQKVTPAPTKAPTPKAPPAPKTPAFTAYKGNDDRQQYFRARAHGMQRVRPGSGITLIREEDCQLQGLTLARGTLLYGKVRFARDRLLIELHTACQGQALPQHVSLEGYENDYNKGLYFKGISDWQEPKEQLASKALGHTSGVVSELGSVALRTWQQWQRKKEVKLPDGRLMWVAQKQR